MTETPLDPHYYLRNFHTVLEWVTQRYGDLLTAEELALTTGFAALPEVSRALLVRMVMRKGERFRASRLHYTEIGCVDAAAGPLIERGWVDGNPALTLDALFALLNKPELARIFGRPSLRSGMRKSDQLESLRAEYPQARRFREWCAGSDDRVYEVLVSAWCERIRLMFFGNFHQDWATFVLSDLGMFRYERVDFPDSSRAFHTRFDVDECLRLDRCRTRMEAGEAVEAVLGDVPRGAYANPWLESRRGKLLFRMAHACERAGELPKSLEIYALSDHSGARMRAIRVLGRTGQEAAALEMAVSAEEAPESESEKQQLLRIIPALRRRLGGPPVRSRRSAPVPRIDLTLSRPDAACAIEGLVQAQLTQTDAPVHYVENLLINSLFGLLCWDAVFTPLPGAFFHPFHRGPADLHARDFYERRKSQFDDCLRELDSDRYQNTIHRNFRAKAGIQSPFVAWGGLDVTLLELALRCLPAAHLKACFERILLDVHANCTGFPDLIQFWPAERRYLMMEVKGPGDRLQDNQTRWLDYFAAHAMPVSVCYVQWIETAAQTATRTAA